MTYNNVVSKMRELARDLLRLKATERFRQEILGLENNKKIHNEFIESLNKDIARTDFKISEIKDNDPDKESKLENLKEVKKNLEDTIEKENEAIENINKEITKVNEKIEKLQKGELLVDADSLDKVTNQLLEEYVGNLAKQFVEGN